MSDWHWMGFHRPDGSVGARNDLLVLSLAGLTGPCARRVAAALVAEGEDGIVVAGDEGVENAQKFMEITCVARAAVWCSVVHIDDPMLPGVAI